MAYVETPSSLGDARSTLASIIYGEAGNQGLVGMQAVGAVIANRASSNFSGYGTDPLSQALAPNQFQGQSVNVPANSPAWSVADAVLNGTNPDPTGGATYYANPGASSAAWARNLNPSNSVQIGDHFFTDNTKGIPFTGNGVAGADFSVFNGSNEGQFGFDPNPDVVTASNGNSADFSAIPDTAFDGAAAPDGPTDNPDHPTTTTDTPDSGSGDTPTDPNAPVITMAPDQAPVTGDLTQFQVAGVNAPIGASVSQTPAPQGDAPQAQGGTGSGGGSPIQITNAPTIGDQAAGTIAQGATTAANTVSKSLTGVGQAVQTAEGSAAAAGTSWLGSIFTSGTNVLVRTAFILLGLLVLAGAFAFFYAEMSKPHEATA